MYSSVLNTGNNDFWWSLHCCFSVFASCVVVSVVHNAYFSCRLFLIQLFSLCVSLHVYKCFLGHVFDIFISYFMDFAVCGIFLILLSTFHYDMSVSRKKGRCCQNLDVYPFLITCIPVQITSHLTRNLSLILCLFKTYKKNWSLFS